MTSKQHNLIENIIIALGTLTIIFTFIYVVHNSKSMKLEQKQELKNKLITLQMDSNIVKAEIKSLLENPVTPPPIYQPIPTSNSTIREVTAYNTGDITQCAGDPCRSANGENICLALEYGYKRCAANFVPFGTILHIEHYGNCMVTDRMNSRYDNRVDIAMKLEEQERARKFGLQHLSVEIIN